MKTRFRCNDDDWTHGRPARLPMPKILRRFDEQLQTTGPSSWNIGFIVDRVHQTDSFSMIFKNCSRT